MTLVLYADNAGERQGSMHRYSLDNSIVYGPEDILLFRESPFASWMERLTLENPGHGIASDPETAAPGSDLKRQDDVARSLEQTGRSVALVDWEKDDVYRRRDTLTAMRDGVDFIVNGELAVGPLAGPANLLSRANGFSELGAWLYLPCATEEKTSLQSALRLCFLADLLHSLQGQLPPQMLILRSGRDLLPLNTDEHIFHYLAIKHRFMRSHREFRKHRMPDPAESTHFGRWSQCARELMRERVEEQLRKDEQEPQVAEPVQEPAVFAVGDAGLGYDASGMTGTVDDARRVEALGAEPETAPAWVSTLLTRTESADLSAEHTASAAPRLTGPRFGDVAPTAESFDTEQNELHDSELSSGVEARLQWSPLNAREDESYGRPYQHAPQVLETAAGAPAAGVPAAGVPADFQQVEIEPKDSEAGATGRQDAADSQSDLAENRRVTGFVFGSGYDSDSGYETDSSYATRPEAGPESDAALALAELEDFERRTFGNTADVEANVDAPASLPVPEVEFSPLDELPVRPFDGRLNTGVVVDMDTPE